MLLQSKDFDIKTAMSIFVVLAMLGSIVLCTPQAQGQLAPSPINVYKSVWAQGFGGGPEEFQSSQWGQVPRVAPTDTCNGIDFFPGQAETCFKFDISFSLYEQTTGFTISDTAITEPIQCTYLDSDWNEFPLDQSTVLDPGSPITCYGAIPYEKTAEKHFNTATVSLTSTNTGEQYLRAVSHVSNLRVTKFINGTDTTQAPGVYLQAGTSVPVTVEIVNEGDVPVTDIALTDSTNLPFVCSGTSLEPGNSTTCTAELPGLADDTQH